MSFPEPLDLSRLNVFPLAERESLSAIDKVLVNPAQAPRPCEAEATGAIRQCAQRIGAARRRGASVMLIYGAHLIKNGAMGIVIELIRQGWVTHLVTNGAGTIHDWELAFLG